LTRTSALHSPLEDVIEVDVAVVGAGITGALTAHLLTVDGKEVALVEMGGSARERLGTLPPSSPWGRV
jgi:glycine/D-amino acid oxidase-like deaminating enzyme